MLPVQTAAMGTQGGDLLPGRAGPRSSRSDEQEHRRAPRSARRRTRSSNPAATRARRATPPTSCTRRPPGARSAATASRAATSRAKRRATSRPSGRPTTATSRWRSPRASGRPGGKPVTLIADAFVTKINTADEGGALGRQERHVARRRHRREAHRRRQGHRDGRRVHRRPAAVVQQPAAQPQRLGRPRLHRPLLRLGHRRLPSLHRLVQGRRFVGPGRLPRLRRARERRPAARAAGIRVDVQRPRHAGRLRQRAGRDREVGRHGGPPARQRAPRADGEHRQAAERSRHHRRRRRGAEPGDAVVDLPRRRARPGAEGHLQAAEPHGAHAGQPRVPRQQGAPSCCEPRARPRCTASAGRR